MMRLSSQNLTQANALKPNYDRTNVSVGIVHLGIGAFHRAHQAVYIDDLLAQQTEQNKKWGIWGVSLRSDTRIINILKMVKFG